VAGVACDSPTMRRSPQGLEATASSLVSNVLLCGAVFGVLVRREFAAFQVALRGARRNWPVIVDCRKRAAWSPPCVRNGADEPYFFISSFFVALPFSILTSMM
jgi:hypothetical protein